MNINRHNYEMYFMLYVDNELSAEERNAVDQFIDVHTDLRPELDLLLKTTLPAEDFFYSGKNDLYKDDIHTESMQEKMLLYLDNELTPVEAESFIAVINSTESLKDEWHILQQAKLNPGEKVVFKNKPSLYRYEKNVITFRMWKMAAAAVFAGIGLFISINLFTGNRTVVNVAVTNREVKLPGKANQVITAKHTQKYTPDLHVTKPVSSSQENNITPFNKIPDALANTNASKPQRIKNQMAITPLRHLENINTPGSNIAASLNVQHKVNELPVKGNVLNVPEMAIAETIKSGLADKAYKIIDNTTETYAKNTLIEENEAETNNNHILFINEERLNRSKISGVFRKVKRVLERNTSIKAGNAIKIAGFGFAVR